MPHGRPAKRRRTTPPVNDDVQSRTVKAADLFAGAADWDLEQEYEQRLRNKRTKTKESTRLPIKTAEGTVQRVEEEEGPDIDEQSDSFLGSGSENEDDDGADVTPPSEVDAVPEIPLKEQIISAKEEVARIAGLLNEDPEEHAGSFKKLAQLASPSSPVPIQKLVLAAQVAVYKDAIPGYRIRAYKDDDLGTKVSKDVRRTRQYEQALVTSYHAYIKQLTSLTRKRHGSPAQLSVRTTAIVCACTLLCSVPHFNFRTELLNILIRELSSREVTDTFTKCISALEQFFTEDEDGAPTLEAVGLLSKMLKVKDYRVREEVLNTFFHLRLLSELAPPSTSADSSQPREKLTGRKGKLAQHQHVTKKERKLRRERAAVEKDMREASALVDHEAREKMQSETLKLVFVAYFRILKARVPSLTGAVLEGLARYAHLINQDLFGDVLEALKDIVSQAEEALADVGSSENDDGLEHSHESLPDQGRNRTRESLLATQTAFTLLSSQDVSKSASALHLDLSFFTSHIYRNLYRLSQDADVELGPKTLRLPDPHSSAQQQQQQNQKFKVNISTPILLLTRILTSLLLTPSQPPPTLLTQAFLKRLLTISLQLPEKSCLAMMELLGRIVDRHGRKVEALWHSEERKGDGVFKGESETVEGTGVMSVGSGVWEGEILRRHWVPGVRDGWKKVEQTIRMSSR